MMCSPTQYIYDLIDREDPKYLVEADNHDHDRVSVVAQSDLPRMLMATWQADKVLNQVVWGKLAIGEKLTWDSNVYLR